MANTPLDPKRVVVAILKGDLDEQFVEIAKAMAERENDGQVRTRWGIRIGDLDITQDRATVGEAFSFETQTGIPWHRAAPGSSALHQVAIVVAHLIEVQGMETADAFKKVKSFNAVELGAGVYEYVDPSPPKDGLQ